jgi:hypothetical protein
MSLHYGANERLGGEQMEITVVDEQEVLLDHSKF